MDANSRSRPTEFSDGTTFAIPVPMLKIQHTRCKSDFSEEVRGWALAQEIDNYPS